MFDRIDAFVRDLTEVKTEADLAGLMAEISREMGFAYFALTHHVDIRRAPGPAIRLANYPPDWIDYFDDHQLGPSDPVHRASQLTSVGFSWSKLTSLIELTPRDRQILDLATRRGIGEGFTVPAHVPGESNGSCSFAADAGAALSEEHLPLAQLAGAFAFEGARRLWTQRGQLATPPPRGLTDRQRDCLLWAARGKTDWEIGRILGVTEETVARHIKQACARYGVSKRTLLAIRALFDGTLTFTDIFRR